MTLAKMIYQELAHRLLAAQNCRTEAQQDWRRKHLQIARDLAETGPSGSGWDCGTHLDLTASRPDRLVLYGSYHHMNDGGYYDGWTDHAIIVRPSLAFGFDLRITGPDRDEIKDYLAEMFDTWLRSAVE